MSWDMAFLLQGVRVGSLKNASSVTVCDVGEKQKRDSKKYRKAIATPCHKKSRGATASIPLDFPHLFKMHVASADDTAKHKKETVVHAEKITGLKTFQ